MSIHPGVLTKAVEVFKEVKEKSREAIEELYCLYRNPNHVITPADLRKILETHNLIKDGRVHPAAAHIITHCRREDGPAVIWLPPIGPAPVEEEFI